MPVDVRSIIRESIREAMLESAVRVIRLDIDGVEVTQAIRTTMPTSISPTPMIAAPTTP